MKRVILNLTQHSATPAQIADGVVELDEATHTKLCELLMFNELPNNKLIASVAQKIGEIAVEYFATKGVIQLPSEGEEKRVLTGEHAYAMIGGAAYLMSPLEKELRICGITPIYSFSVRKSTEEHLPDGSVRKIQIFEHLGFVNNVYDFNDTNKSVFFLGDD